MTGTAPRLTVRDLCKSFDDVAVLRDVNLDLAAGEVQALVGENGSGKSTLVKILTGYYQADSGTLRIDGHPLDHHRNRIAVIHQDLGLVANLSVLDNIAVGTRFGATAFAPIPVRAMRERAETALRSVRGDLDLDASTEELTGPERTLVAVARALLRLGSIALSEALFILDEPTAVATSAQADELMSLMRRMADAGAAVMFISHRLAEARAADRITVLRDGQVVCRGVAAELSEQDIIDAMLGRRLGAYYPDKLATPTAPVVLSATGLRGRTLAGIDLEVRRGEIVGVTGVGGMGQDELPALLCAAATRTGGTVRVGTPPEHVEVTSYSQALDAGVAYVPADRRREGGWTLATAQENVSLPVLGRLRRHGRIDRRAEAALARRVMGATGVVPADPAKPFGLFSGGNQQKLVVGRWLHRKPQVLILHEPTQGVDVGARRDLIALLNQEATGGTAVLVCSNDYEQLAEICHRVLVLHDGVIRRELTGEEVSESSIAAAAHMAAPNPH